MYFRCPECRASSGVTAFVEGYLICRECDHGFPIERERQLTSASHDEAVRLSREQGIDLPSAYSVVLGIVEPERAVELTAEARSARQAARGKRATPERTDTTRYLTRNEELQKGVARATQSVRMAEKTEERRQAAEALVTQHGIPIHIAGMVVDNRISIDEALHQLPRARLTLRERLRPANATQGQKFLLMTAMIAIVISVSWSAWRGSTARMQERLVRPPLSQRTAPSRLAIEEKAPLPAWASLSGTEIARNEFNQILKVTGSDPRSVLLAFCSEEAAAQQCTPEALTETVPRQNGARLGLFRNGDRQFAIRIERDPRTLRWSVGDGTEPIEWDPAAELRVGRRRADLAGVVPPS